MAVLREFIIGESFWTGVSQPQEPGTYNARSVARGELAGIRCLYGYCIRFPHFYPKTVQINIQNSPDHTFQITSWVIFIIFSTRISVHNSKVVARSSYWKAWKPVIPTWVHIDLDEWPSHGLYTFTLFSPIPMYTTMDIWTVKTFLDPLKTLRFPHFPWARLKQQNTSSQAYYLN